MPKSTVTKSLGPLHFEDLDPHRFEDLVRELAYDFREWITIEATGRSGADDGFDIRAFERIAGVRDGVVEFEDDGETPHPMDGRVWKFQCKRERAIGPKKLQSIVVDGVHEADPPYGYILAAPANFSKAAYDKFREELRSRGVMEFYLWGRAELEDMLYLPRNDRILFAFFGVSLVTRKRSRATELRSLITVKNKLQKLLGTHPGSVNVLLRDSKDSNYPYRDKYDDFAIRPRWIEKRVVEMHPLGLILEVARYFAVCDHKNGTWDYSDVLNQLNNTSSHVDEDYNYQLRERIEAFVERHPRSHHATLVELRYVRFDSIVVVDGDGDTKYEIPHIYVDFHPENGPYSGGHKYISFNDHHDEPLEDLTRIKIFPEVFEALRDPRIHKEKRLTVPDVLHLGLKKHWRNDYTLYDCDGRMDFLNASDVIAVADLVDENGEEIYIRITHKRIETATKLFRKSSHDPISIQSIESQIGRKLVRKDTVAVLEFKQLYSWQLRDMETIG